MGMQNMMTTIAIVTMIRLLMSNVYEENIIELREIPQLSYHSSDLENTQYVCYQDILIINGIIYKKQGEGYRKTGRVNHLAGIEEDRWIDYAQYKNKLVVKAEEGLLIYDMDTWTCIGCLEDRMQPWWFIYQGKILYLNEENILFSVSLLNGEKRKYDIFNADEENVVVDEFRIREDGKVVFGRKNDGVREFWMLEMNENGILEEKKLWETSRWKYRYWLDFNQYGLIVMGQHFSEMEIVCIRENGDVMELNFDLLGEFLFLDDGYVGCDKVEFDENEIGTYEIWKVKRSTTSVSRYDYEGNKAATYQLVSDELIEQGYYLGELIYDEGTLTGFYIQDGTDELYISQIDIG